MLEKQLISAINKNLPRPFYSNSNTGSSMAMNGLPDRYYDPAGGNDLWVEYKMRDAMPRDGMVGGIDNKKRGYYSTLQYEWMVRRYNNSLAHGRPNVVGIIGLPNRTAVIQTTPTEWREGSSITLAIPLKEVSLWIADFCLPSSASLVRSSSGPRPSTLRTA